MELSDAVLHSFPHLANSRWHALRADEVVKAGLEDLDLSLDVDALGEAGAHESGVDDEKNPAAALEENSSTEHTEPQYQLEEGDHRHGLVVVLRNKVSDRLGKRVLSVLRLGGGSCWGSTRGRADFLRNDDGRDQVRTRVCGHVEDRVNSVREQCDRVLRHEEPDKGHHCARADSGTVRTHARRYSEGYQGVGNKSSYRDIGCYHPQCIQGRSVAWHSSFDEPSMSCILLRRTFLRRRQRSTGMCTSPTSSSS
jgi:hypothetical protein